MKNFFLVRFSCKIGWFLNFLKDVNLKVLNFLVSYFFHFLTGISFKMGFLYRNRNRVLSDTCYRPYDEVKSESESIFGPLIFFPEKSLVKNSKLPVSIEESPF